MRQQRWGDKGKRFGRYAAAQKTQLRFFNALKAGIIKVNNALQALGFQDALQPFFKAVNALVKRL